MKKLLLILTLLTTTFATICADNVTPEKGYQLSGTVVDVRLPNDALWQAQC